MSWSISASMPTQDAAATLRRYGLRAKKRLGQSFLEDPLALQEITAAAEITPGDVVLEIGPGLGSLTRYLAAAARRVVAVELDAQLMPPLQEAVRGCENVQLVQGDMLELRPSDLGLESGYLIAANIPYYITSALMRHVLESEPRPRRIVFTIQADVAARICAAPGKLSLLALSVQVYGEPQEVGRIPAGAFYPKPNVESAILRIDIYAEPQVPAGLLDTFFGLIKAGFGQKRKMLRNALAAGLHIEPSAAEEKLQQSGIDPRRRAETLSIPEWKRLCEVVRG
jgi:16S rRNA (adenine1518-N6/adenine1519-N6)-dimethyltransferase